MTQKYKIREPEYDAVQGAILKDEELVPRWASLLFNIAWGIDDAGNIVFVPLGMGMDDTDWLVVLGSQYMLYSDEQFKARFAPIEGA